MAATYHCSCRVKMEWYLPVLISKYVYYVLRNNPYIFSKYFLATPGTSKIIKMHHDRRIITHTFPNGSDRCDVLALGIPFPTFVFQICRKWIPMNRKSSKNYIMQQVHSVIIVSELPAAVPIQIVFIMHHMYVFSRGYMCFYPPVNY